ncbi:hypothetical protein [Selenomonas sp. F0473]|uniref:hypothetical protein n=1 Tax=Selenomonas sp. F0473 TaxID=999423 RepID=UPI00029E7B4E|nr:hypothetical protein [Selenomonas sp. F0473]EKU70486.1 hypothetical protein HMPREF9161_01532 [Selenomonas sp. F0473]
MRRGVREREAGYLLLETVALGLIVLAAAAVLGLFARTALLDAEGRARTDAALLARERFSASAAELDAGGTVSGGVTEVRRSDTVYTVSADVARKDVFYDVTLHISWTVCGRARSADYVRRMRGRHAAGN